MKQENQRGLSVVEILIAIALLMIIAVGSVVSLLGSFASARLAAQETRATNLASECLEAVASIRDKSWSNLAAGTYGLSRSGGSWAFSGSSDTSGIYTRSVTVATVSRNSGGNIVTSGGTLDPNTFRFSCLLSWNVTPSRPNSVTLQTYLTNWQKASNLSSTRVIDSCTTYCATQGYVGGTCRSSSPTCANNGQVYKSGGNFYCTGGPSADTCCCSP